MSLVRRWRGMAMAARVDRETREYAGCWTGRHDEWQLAAFNRQWQGLVTRVPYWSSLKTERGLPEHFDTWEQVRSGLPVLERSDLRTRVRELCDPRHPPCQWRSTGGSTGEPLRVPVSRGEIRASAADVWYARSWFDISPSDRAFLIWGHSHLLGRGLAGWFRGQFRTWKDRLAGYRRWSAYRIGEADLRESGQRLLNFRPAYLLGYAVALDRFAMVNEVIAPQLRALGLKAVIATAESFPRSDSRSVVQAAFGCPVVMEYGAVETGPIAHETPAGGYRVFWRWYFAEVVPSTVAPGSWELILTSLYPRCLPLIRYRVGDLIVPLSEPPRSPLLEFRSVLGRCNDYVILKDGCTVHSEAFTHAVKETQSISAYQVAQKLDGSIRLTYTAGQPLTPAEITEIRKRLVRVHPGLSNILIEHSGSLAQSIAGKTRTVIRST